VPAPGRSDLDDGAPRYQLLGYLASGGMAELYFARVVGLAGFERHVVLKRIVAHHARDPEFVAMFLDEARLAAQLHHPNIAQVFDIGRMVDSYFFTMEYIHGESARALFRRCVAQQRTMPLHLVLTVVAGAAAGLHYAHEKRSPDEVPLAIVHRDVSPSNVMIGFDGAVKVVDFGIARAVTRSVETRSGVVRGKLGYMAPEQCKGEPLDRRCDVFALGIMLFELATMTRLYEAEASTASSRPSRARRRVPARGARSCRPRSTRSSRARSRAAARIDTRRRPS
jgi:serine/threonine-protein kinase